jgi:hypothetical protein
MTIRHRNLAATAWIVVLLGAAGLVGADEPRPGTAWVEQVLKGRTEGKRGSVVFAVSASTRAHATISIGRSRGARRRPKGLHS